MYSASIEATALSAPVALPSRHLLLSCHHRPDPCVAASRSRDYFCYPLTGFCCGWDTSQMVEMPERQHTIRHRHTTSILARQARSSTSYRHRLHCSILPYHPFIPMGFVTPPPLPPVDWAVISYTLIAAAEQQADLMILTNYDF